MEPILERDSDLSALEARLSPEDWRARVEEARAQLAIILAVRAVQATEEISETAALARVAPGLHRSTYRHRVERFENGGGLAGLVDRTPPPPPKAVKVTPAASAIMCALRQVNLHVEVEQIARVIERQLGIKLSASVIKRELKEKGFNRPRGGGSGRPEGATKPAHSEELLFGGAVFLAAMDESSGYSREMAEVMATQAGAAVAAAPAPESRPEVEGVRDEGGRFTAIYNQANAKGDAALGPVFRSVKEKRKEVDLGARRLVGDSVETIRRKNQAILALPYLTDNGKAVQIDDYRAHRGIREACGENYVGETLERHLRDEKYLGAGDALLDFHLAFWLRHEPRPATGETPTAFFIYVDGHNKALFTHHFTRAGKVSSNGRIMPCLDQVFVHTGTGTPIYWQTFSGNAGLTTHTIPILDELEAKVGGGWTADRIVVIDAEGCAVGFLRRLKASGRDFITRVKPSRVPDLSEVRDLSSFEPYRDGDEIADGFITLTAKDEEPYDVRVAIMRRTRAGQIIALATSVEREQMTPTQIAEGYVDRWGRQELRFKQFVSAKFKRVAGYGKQRVSNVTVVTELVKLEASKQNLAKRIEGQAEKVKLAKQKLTRAKQKLNAALARRKRHDERVENELLVEQPNPIKLWNGVKALEAERERHPKAVAEVLDATAVHETVTAKLAELEAALPKLAKRKSELEDRREIYRADVELDRVVSVYKLGFVLMCEMVLREYFGGMKITLATFMRQILHLPATRTVDGTKEYVRFFCPPNPEIHAALEVACERVSNLKLRRNGRILHMSVDARHSEQKKRSSRNC